MTDTTTSNETVTEVLRRQHDQVKALFGEMDGADGETRTQVFDCLRALLAVHETAEEEVVYPAARSASGDAESTVDARLKEESEAKTVLSELEKLGPDGEGFAAKFSTFRAAVLDHAEHEEHEVFPLLERNLDADTLKSMANTLLKAEKMAPTHPHPHGPEGAMGNLVLGPFVAMADKVRDALKQRDA
ncbi:MAG: hemerythrin domain-containing protein [Chloroflexi bacterium]|nr:hemerythrin domain-containing protein [Chloroflexota bacterium]